LIPSLGVSDIDRSVRFYSELFGFRVRDSYEAEGRTIWCWLTTDGSELMLQQLSADQQIRLNPAIGQSWVIYIRPDDIDAIHTRLTTAGIPCTEVTTTDYGAREFFLRDPDGYELWLAMPSAAGNGDEEEDDEEQEEDEDEDEDEEDDDEEQWQVTGLASAPPRPAQS
jgi:catechol 2,3-dioxygenase-like lactoylglutathione lyase family enzyme